MQRLLMEFLAHYSLADSLSPAIVLICSENGVGVQWSKETQTSTSSLAHAMASTPVP